MGYEEIWAPWRLRYVTGQSKGDEPTPRPKDYLVGADPDCFICQAVADSADRQRLVVHRTDRSITILNLYPYNNGHLLVAPQRHHARLDELSPEETLDVSGQIAEMVGLLEGVLRPEGFNVGLNLGRVAGAGLPGHLHWHVVPRWNGDTNFMPVMASVNVIPQSLGALWEMLSEAIVRGQSERPATDADPGAKE